MKVLLDTNIFSISEGAFSNLLFHLEKQSLKHQIYGNTVALDELTYTTKTDQIEYLEPIKRFLKITNDRWFKSKNHLIESEFSRGKKNKYWFFSCKREKDIKAKLKKIITANGDLSHDMIFSGLELRQSPDANDEIATFLKKNFRDPVDVNGVSRTLKQELNNSGINSFESFFNHKDCDQGKNDISRVLLDTYVGPEAFKTFILKQDQYPYFQILIKTFMFMEFYTAWGNDGKNQTKIDPGARNDIWQIVLMRDLDVFVTEEKGFAKDCFNAIWKNSSKKCLSLQEFINL